MDAQTPKQPWDRRRGESLAAYTHFLFYRNLGPARTLDVAYQTYLRTLPDDHQGGGAGKGDKRRAPGCWAKESASRDWPQRAAAWDVHVLAETGREAITHYCALLRQTAQRCLAVIIDGAIAPDSWQSLIETLNTLGNLIPPELITGVAQEGQGNRRG
jgi:hypothetical protein